MIGDPHRERDLAALDVTASVESEGGMCVIRMTCDQFDRMLEGVAKTADTPDWWEEAQDELDSAEAALQEVAYLIRKAERDSKQIRRAS